MRREKKRLAAAVLALVLVFVMSGTFAFAEEPEISGEDETHAEIAAEETSGADQLSAGEENTEVMVCSWEWCDGLDILQYADGVWGLGLPGVSENNPLTGEGLLELLPGEITADTQEGTETLELNWDLSQIPEGGLTSGDYTFTAGLPEGYVLAEDAEPLTVTVQLGGAETYTALPSGTPPYQNHIVNGVSPSGTTINLFDYWITSQTAADDSNGEGIAFLNSGINDGHALVFGSGLEGYNLGNWNAWTGNKNPKTGIVSNTLVDGYPQLSVDAGTAGQQIIQDRNGSESLAYLFDPSISAEGKASYEDVQGLLQVDSNGYYYYNSQMNYAVYYPDTKSFVLYDLPGVLPGGNSPVGQFFPFNAATSDGGYFGDWSSYQLMNGVKSNDSSINHYFGLTMSTRFIQQNGGYTDETRRTPVTYEFSGDDDVWIFIDGKLVADLGGIHDAASVKIDFSTGQIWINDTLQSQQLGSILGLGSDTLTDNTYHTLDFFYLERGNVDSNMQLKYNLVTIPESSVIKIDQTGDPVAGAEFKLYAANDSNTPIATGTTDRNGEFVFLDGNDFPITINSLYDEYKDVTDENGNNLILKETFVPDGYRSNGDIGLYFYQGKSDEVLLLSNSIWDKGAYAMAKVTTTTPNVIQLLETATETGVHGTVTLVGNDAVENPLMFAVVFQKQENGIWLPVSGDPLSGWTVAGDSSWSSVLQAATANPYVFQLASSGAYQVEVENLPGDIKTYYHICQDETKAEYTIAYYYTTASTIASASATNTWRINSDPGVDEQYDLERVFSMDLYVPNIKNRLLVQKVDDNGATVNGAEFELYAAAQVTVDGDSVTVKEGENPYDSLTTADVTGILNLNGGGIFPTENHVLAKGEYYLIETSAPGGYQLNDTAVHVVIDDTGVYADAGDADDGVTVLRGVGSVLRSMLQFAVDDKVDTTLNSIKAALAQSVEYTNGEFTAEEADWDNPSVLHLKYANANGLLDYGLYDTDKEGTIDNLTLATESGWSRLLIRQCYQHDATVDTSLKTELEDTDITNLFSGTVTVRVENERTGNLKISKTVTGDNAPADQDFTFQVTLTDGENPVAGEYAKSDGNTITFNAEGKATVTLKAGESITIWNLPEGAEYTVEETSVPSGFTPSVRGDGTTDADNPAKMTGTIPHNTTQDAAAEVNYTNTFDGSVKAAVNGTKTLDGRNLTANDTYRFRIAGNDETTTQAIENGTVVLPTVTEVSVTGDGTSAQADFTFGEITFKAAETYEFAVTEIFPQGVTEDSPVQDGICYDTHTSVVTVTVTEQNGILSAAVACSNAGAPSESDAAETEKAAFTNTLVADLSFTKEKKDGTPLGGAVFALYRLDCTDNSHNHGSEEIQTKEDGDFADGYQYKNCWTLVQIAVSDLASGLVSFTDIPVSGTYRLAEIQVPAGYMNPGGQWTVHYDKETSAFAFGTSVGNPPAVKEKDGNYSIINYMPGELPFAGNRGIRIFLTTGVVLMAAGALGFALRLKRKRRML